MAGTIHVQVVSDVMEQRIVQQVRYKVFRPNVLISYSVALFQRLKFEAAVCDYFCRF